MRTLVVLLFFVLVCGMGPSAAQAPPPQSANSPQPPDFQAKIDAAALVFRDGDPRLKGASPEYLQGLAEFVSGNMLFVLLHELGHAAITLMGLPVLGKTEDAADTFAALMLLRIGSDFSHGVLADAAEGWFLAHRRDQKTGDEVAFYDEHGLNQQRAYHIVCLMVGSDPEKFKDLADEAKLPKARQDSCVGDYSNAVYSWDLLLKSHRRTPDQPKTKIAVVYGPADGKAAVARQVARSVQLLETVAEHAADEFVWRSPFTLEMKSCGFPNARWHVPSHTLTLCYELATDFADLYRQYGNTRANSTRLAHSVRPKTGRSMTGKSSNQSSHRKRKLGHRTHVAERCGGRKAPTPGKCGVGAPTEVSNRREALLPTLSILDAIESCDNSVFWTSTGRFSGNQCSFCIIPIDVHDSSGRDQAHYELLQASFSNGVSRGICTDGERNCAV
jgi:hypothetical protein